MSMQTILAAGQSLSRMQTMQSTRSQIQGQANILRIESKLDGGNAKKDEKADALEEKTNLLMNNLMEEVSDVNETLKPEEDEEKETEEAAQKPKTDTLELSDYGTRLSEEQPATKVAVGEPVAYKADGSTAPSDSEKSSPKMKLTA